MQAYVIVNVFKQSSHRPRGL